MTSLPSGHNSTGRSQDREVSAYTGNAYAFILNFRGSCILISNKGHASVVNWLSSFQRMQKAWSLITGLQSASATRTIIIKLPLASLQRPGLKAPKTKVFTSKPSRNGERERSTSSGLKISLSYFIGFFSLWNFIFVQCCYEGRIGFYFFDGE